MAKIIIPECKWLNIPVREIEIETGDLVLATDSERKKANDLEGATLGVFDNTSQDNIYFSRGYFLGRNSEKFG